MNRLRKGILSLLIASLALCSGAFALLSLNSGSVALAANSPAVHAETDDVTSLNVHELFSWVGKVKLDDGQDGQTPTYGEPFSLINASVHVYSRIGDETNLDTMRYSLTELTDDEIAQGYRLAYVANANNAVARNRGAEITVDLDVYSQYKDIITYSFEDIIFEGSPQTPGTNYSSAMGPHTATVAITCPEGYAFYNYDSSSSGILISADRRTALISKDWYIVEVGNPLVFAPEQSDDEVTTPDDADPDFWNVSGWTYNAVTQNPVAPVLMYNDDEADWNVDEEVTFDLINNNNNDLSFYGRELGSFAEYINYSMPAGTYSIIFHVPAVTHDTIIYNGYAETYTFTVSPAQFKDEWRAEIIEKLVDLSHEATRNNDAYVFPLYGKDSDAAIPVDLAAWSDFNSSNPFNPVRQGVWADDGYNNYYSDRYYLTYNLDRLQNNTYLNYAAMSQFNAAPDTYTVYYQLQANNYESLTNVMNDAERRAYKFTLVIYEILSEPTLERLIFNNTAQLISGTNRYEVIADENDTYIDVGNHTVTLKSLDGAHYVWKVGDELKSEIQFTYTITRVDNAETQELYLPGWEYNNYDSDVKPVWATMFTEDGADDFFTFVLQAEDGTTYAQSEFGNAPVGTYTLIATAKGYIDGDETTEHYNWNVFTNTATLHISKTTNTWYITPDVIQWQYKGFDADTNHFLAAARVSSPDNPVLFSVATDEEGKNIIDGLKDFTTNNENKVTDQKVIDNLNKLNAGVYYLITSVEETDDYTGLNPQPHRFEVNVADNAWDKKLSISTWISGKYNADENLIEAVARFGEVHFRIVDAEDDTKVIYDDKAGINELSSAPVGNYTLTVEVADDVNGNFKGISDFLNFRIFEKPGLPWWVTVIIVVAALGVAALVLYILHQKGILQLLSGKIVVAMRTKATVDATIAAIRANKVAENARKSVALAEEQDKLEQKNTEQSATDTNKGAPKDE